MGNLRVLLECILWEILATVSSVLKIFSDLNCGRRFTHTSDMAAAHGVTGATTWPYISLGAGYRRCLTTVPDVPDAPNATLPCVVAPEVAYGTVYDIGWNFDAAYSAFLGAQINQPKFEHSNWGPWERATAAIFYPSVFDPRGVDSQLTPGASSNLMDHFVAYVRGATGMAASKTFSDGNRDA